MKFKVLKGTDLFKKLNEVRKTIDAANKAAGKLAEEMGGTGNFCSSRSHLAGGLSAIEFTERPEGFKQVGEKWNNLYMPISRYKVWWEKIAALPKVPHAAINDLLNYKHGGYSNSRGLFWTTAPGVAWRPSCILIVTPEDYPYTSVADMIEIVESEYEKLKGKAK